MYVFVTNTCAHILAIRDGTTDTSSNRPGRREEKAFDAN